MENQDSQGAPPDADALTIDHAAELEKAKARISELEGEATKAAPLVEIGRKAARAQTRASVLGTAKVIAGGDAAFEIVIDSAAASLGLDIDHPLSDDDRRRLVAKVYEAARPLLDNGKPGAIAGTGTNEEPPRRRGL